MENYNNRIYEEEIDLYELIMLFWRRKVLIINCILLFAVIIGVGTKLFISPLYQTRLNFIVNIPERLPTKYGDYPMAIKTNGEIIDLINTNGVMQEAIAKLGDESLTVTELRDKLVIEKNDQTPNTFRILVGADTPKKSYEMANVIYNSYINYLEYYFTEKSLTYFSDEYQVQIEYDTINIELKKKLLDNANKLIQSMPKTYVNSELISSIPRTTDLIVSGDIINPNWLALESEIMQLNKYIQDTNTVIAFKKQMLSVIQTDLERLSADRNEDVSIENYISLVAQPIIPTQKVSPSTIMNTLIGAALGGMLACFYVLFESWVKNRVSA